MQFKLESSDEYLRNIAIWLKQARLEKKLTMRELALELGVAHTAIGKIELFQRRLDVGEFLIYCAALGVNPVDGLTAAKKGPPAAQ